GRSPTKGFTTKGFTLLEITIVVALLAVIVVGAFGLLDTGNTIFRQGSVKQLTQIQAQKVLDEVADDFKNSAAWQYFQVNTSGASPTRLTKFWASKRLT